MTQIWQLGSTLFSTFGVFVQSHNGILDFPAQTDEGHDWLDQDGKNYWLEPDDLKKSDRDIILNCWITAATYEDFKTNVAAFFTAIKGEGMASLTTPFCTLDNVALHDAVPVTRKSTYVMSRSAGVFTLRMKVMGDSVYSLLMAVYRPASPELPSGSLAGYISAGNDMKVYKRMHGEAYVTCQVEQNSGVTFRREDYIMILSSSFITPEKYYLDKAPEVRKLSSNKYVVSYRFEQEPYRLNKIAFLSENLEGDFYWFANLDEIISRMILNTARYSAGMFVSDGSIPSTVRKTHKFSAQSCWDVLVAMCEEYELEFAWRYDGSAVWTLTIAERIERTWPFQMEYGKGEGFYEIQRDALNREELCTVLYAYGANKNLKYDYGSERLVCPGNPLEQNITTYGRIEQIQYFEDVFPALSASADAYDQVLAVTGDPAYEAIKEVWPTGMFRMTATLGFNLAETDAEGYSTYLLGIPAKVAMRTGDLAGMEFEINKYDPVDSDDPTGPGYIFLDPIVDEHAGTFPNEDFYIAAGDQFTLLDINLPESYVTDAEASLLATATAWLADHSTPKLTYRATLDPAIVKSMVDSGFFNSGLDIGDSIEIIDTDFAMNGYFRVSELTMDYESKRYDLTLSEKRPLTPREQLIQTVRKLEKTVDATKSNTEIGTQKSDETTAEVLNRTFDRRDGKFKPDNVRTESADPRTLAYDAGVPQFQVIGMIVETSYQGDDNKVKVSAGSIEVLNWAPLTRTRYEIDKMVTEGDVYDPRRTWTFPETIITLPDNDPYYLLAKLPRDPLTTTGTLVATDTWIRVKADADYLQYNLGMLNAPGSPRVASMLWGNVRIGAGQITNAIDPRLLTGGQMIYLHGNDSDLTGMKKALTDEPDEAMVTYTAAANTITGDVLIKEFATDPDYPGVTVIPAGPWIFNHWVAVGSGTQSLLVVKVYKRVAAGTETELFAFTQAVTAAIAAEQFKAVPMAQVELLATDRLVVKYYHRNAAAASATMYLFVEGNAIAEWKWSGYRIPLDPASGGLATVETDMSVTGDGSAEDPVKLVGDEEAPGNDKYYGTNEVGEKGFHDLPEEFNPLEVIEGTITNIEYGGLYNHYAIQDIRNMAPVGWHVATDSDWDALITAVGGNLVAGGVLKEVGTEYWYAPNVDATNEYGFNARGSGARIDLDGSYSSIRAFGRYWGANATPMGYRISYDTASVLKTTYYPDDKQYGFAVRWVKDDSTDPGVIEGNDGKVYPTTKIGNQVWTACNVLETRFRNGDAIDGPFFGDSEWIALETPAYCVYDDEPDNASTGKVDIIHNNTKNIQGGTSGERYHHTKNEIGTHVYEANIDGKQYARKDGAWVEVEASGGGIDDIYIEPDPTFPIDYLYKEVDSVQTLITDIPKADGVVAGGHISWLGGLSYQIDPTAWYKAGDLYSIKPDTDIMTLTLNPADSGDDRIDALVLNIVNGFTFIEGTPSANPMRPTIDAGTDIFLTDVYVGAGETEPDPIPTDELVYNENVEWAVTASGPTINADYTGEHYVGSKSINVGGIANFEYIQFEAGIGETFDTADWINIIGNIKLKATMNTRKMHLSVVFLLNGVTINNPEKFTIDGATTAWQNLALTFSRINFFGTEFNQIRFYFYKTTGGDFTGFYLDYIKLESGIVQPVVNQSVQLIGDVIGNGVTGVPIPTALKVVNANIGTYGDGTHVARITVDAKGRITAVEEVVIEPGMSEVETADSVVGSGSASDPITLDGDEAEPGPLKYYGTDDSSEPVKGFHDLPTGADLSIISESSGSFNVSSTHLKKYCRVNYATDVTATLPADTFSAGDWGVFEQKGNGTVTIDGDSGVTVNGYDGLTTYGQYAGIMWLCVASNTFIVIAGTGY